MSSLALIRLVTRQSLAPRTVNICKRFNHVEEVKNKDEPVKFSSSEANVDYKSIRNFYSRRTDVPASHNFCIAISCVAGFFYLIFLRDDVDSDGGASLLRPVHESVPELAIPLLESAIAENRKLGYNTTKLDKKLEEYLKEPEKYGGERRRFIEN